MHRDHDDEPKQVTGPFARNPKVIIKVYKSFDVRGNVDIIDVLGANVLITLPDGPRRGEDININAIAGVVLVQGGYFSILGVPSGKSALVPQGASAIFTFTSSDEWIALVSATFQSV